ncbi:MAG: hypothetical protein AB1609_03150 [Bacillota bacterium]
MRRKRVESTVYLGRELVRQLAEYRRRFAIPPSASAVVREALARYLADEIGVRDLPPGEWVRATEPLLSRLKQQGVHVTTEAILEAIRVSEEQRTRAMLGGEG